MNQELIEQGNEFYLNGNFNKALDCYFKHLFKNEPSAELFMKIGHCNKMMNDNENAIEYYIKSLELEPENLESLFNCAEAYTLY